MLDFLCFARCSNDVFCYTHGQVAETTLSVFGLERGSVISREWDSPTLNNGLIAFANLGYQVYISYLRETFLPPSYREKYYNERTR